MNIWITTILFNDISKKRSMYIAVHLMMTLMMILSPLILKP